MLPVEIIRKKRDGEILSDEELNSFFRGVIDGSVADYQTSAMLMAIFIRGMTINDCATLTNIMRDSGSKLDWRAAGKPTVDKHSTGGVGDKTSLILLPLCTLFDVVVPMIAGRGLGHTGGTLDKLEAIQGMNVFPDISEAQRIVRDYGGVFLGQTAQLAPLDKKLYALRDVTGTVESIPLITASIQSKKLAEGISSLVMDVKYGSGAFMREFKAAVALAESLLVVGKACGLNMNCLVTNTNSPLDRMSGNALEVAECIEIMQGGGPEDMVELCMELAKSMLDLSGVPMLNLDERIRKELKSGRVFERFCKIVAAQGGDCTLLEHPERLPQATIREDYCAREAGYISAIDVRQLGLAIIELGGGRRRTEDKVDPAVGLSRTLHVGEAVASGQPLLTIHASSATGLAKAKQILDAGTFQVSAQKPEAQPLVAKRMT